MNFASILALIQEIAAAIAALTPAQKQAMKRRLRSSGPVTADTIAADETALQGLVTQFVTAQSALVLATNAAAAGNQTLASAQLAVQNLAGSITTSLAQLQTDITALEAQTSGTTTPTPTPAPA